MNRTNAKKLAEYHKFTKRELYDILVEALDTYSDDFWKKPNKINGIFDNGSYFNSCRDWLSYKEGQDNDIPPKIVVIRILEVFGEFSKVKLPKKIKKKDVKIMVSEKPTLNIDKNERKKISNN